MSINANSIFIISDDIAAQFNEYGDLIIKEYCAPWDDYSTVSTTIPKRLALQLASFIIESLDEENLEKPSKDRISYIKSRYTTLTKKELKGIKK